MATQAVHEEGKPPSMANIFLACMLLLSAVPTQGDSYWAYVPKPPLIHPVTWQEREHIKVMTNVSDILGGTPIFSVGPIKSSTLTYEGRADSAPICFSLLGFSISGCLPVAYRTFVTDAPESVEKPTPEKRLVWELQIKTLGWYTENETASTTETLPITDCLHKYKNQDSQWIYDDQTPNWLSCGFQKKGIPYVVTGTNTTVWDFSVSSPNYNQAGYFKNNSEKFNNYNSKDKVIHRFFTAGFVEPVWITKNTDGSSLMQMDLFRLAAAADMILWTKPKATHPEPIGARACVGYPFGILMAKRSLFSVRPISSNSYHIKCLQCVLTNCMENDFKKEFDVMLLVKRPAYVMMPVDLKQEAWFEDTGLMVVQRLNELLRPKRFVAALILGISALIAILTSFAVSTTALVKNIQTAHFVNDMHRNISLILAEQHIIDKKLGAKLNALEEVVIALGQDVANIKARMATKCHVSFKYICVTPAKYNDTENWNKTKAHLLGIWKDNDLTHDFQEVQDYITATSTAHLNNFGFESLAQQLYENVSALNPFTWWHYAIVAAVALIIIIVVFMVFPCLFRALLLAIKTTRRDLEEFRLKNKKPGTATPVWPDRQATTAV